MRCRRCGHDNEGTANFCSSCGEPLGEEDTTVSLDLIEHRRELEQEIGDVLEQLPLGLGLLVVRRGPNAGSTFVLEAENTSLGRHPRSDIFLDDVTVSRRHAVIRRKNGEYELSDAGSLNGTYVDHERVDSAILTDMNEVQIGRFVLTFVVGERSGGVMSSDVIDGSESHLSIGEVLAELRQDFPDITISKIRFLESQGLIDPERTPSGYRRFYEPDLERLRWILLQQRDHFLPLRVIKERLDDFGPDGAPAPRSRTGAPGLSAAGTASSPASTEREPSTSSSPARPFMSPSRPSPAPVVARPEPVSSPFDDLSEALSAEDEQDEVDAVPDDSAVHSGVGLTRVELLETTGLTDAQLDALESFGIVLPVSGDAGRPIYDDEALAIAEIGAGYYRRGVEARHLKMYVHSGDREAALFAQVVMPLMRQRNPLARERLVDELEELARLGRQLRTAMLRRALRQTLSE